MKNEISCGVVAVIKNKGVYNTLVIHQASGNHWTLCKGHIELSDANNLETAKRELLEEVNLTVKEWLFDGKTFENNYTFTRHSQIVSKRNIFYCGLIANESELKKQDTEILDYKWLDFKSAIALLTWDTDKQVLQQVLQQLTS